MRFTKTIATALAVSVGALSFASSADARSRHRPHGGHHGHHGHHGYHHNGFNGGAAFFGFATGALLGSALAYPYYGYGGYGYGGYGYGGYGYAPAPVYAAPVVTYQPWTPDWYDYCRGKYRSFDDSTGEYLGYDGEYHFCR
jgi:hypothetical protein